MIPARKHGGEGDSGDSSPRPSQSTLLLPSAAREGLHRYRLRGVLSALGIAVGAAAMVLLTSLVESASKEASAGLVRLGHNRLFISSVPSQPGSAKKRRVLSLGDAVAIRRQIPEVNLVTPSVVLSATIVACRERKAVNVRAVGPEHFVLESQSLKQGRYVSDWDIRARSSVAVIGYSLARSTHCLAHLGATVQIGAQNYEVVGLLGQRGQRWGDDLDDTVYIPFTTAEMRYLQFGTPVSLIATVREGADVAKVQRSIERLLQRRGTDRGNGGAAVSQADLLGQMSELSRTVSGFVAILMSVALIIAGIGIVNSVMTSVVERTSEIGLRRAVGARRRQVAQQFFGEALVITLGGALGGVLLGAGASFAVSKLMHLPVVLNIRMAGFALLASLVLGIICGVWPAIRAAGMAPTDALRHE